MASRINELMIVGGRIWSAILYVSFKSMLNYYFALFTGDTLTLHREFIFDISFF